MKPTMTLIVAANGAKARFYVHSGPGKALDHLARHDMDVDHPPARDMKSDRPGRTFESATHGRSAMEPKTDPAKRAEADFVSDVATTAGQIVGNLQIDQIIVCADPVSLGTFRKAASKALTDLVSSEISKNLVDLPERDLKQHLADVLPV